MDSPASPTHPCPVCGAVLVGRDEGWCPACALRDALQHADDSETPSTAGLALADIPPAGSSHSRIGKYLVEALIGGGGMGTVYRARDPDLDRVVVIKTLTGRTSTREEFRLRFQQEARSVARLNHGNIVKVHDFGEHQNQPYLVMEFIDGGTLAQRKREFHGQPRKAAGLVKRLAEAVEHAHQRGVIHRDLKPANVLLDADGQPRITDYGLAVLLAEDTPETGRMLSPAGSPGYLAPEQAGTVSTEVTVAVDIWSLGVILYELLTGQRPFDAGSRTATLAQIRDAPPRGWGVAGQWVNADLAAICLKCLSKTPEGRYRSAAELADDLGRHLDRRPVNARPATAGERLWKWARRHPLAASLAATTMLALIAGLVGTTWQGRRLAAALRTQKETSAELNLTVAGYLQAEGRALASLDRLADAVEVAPHAGLPVQRLLHTLTYEGFPLPLTTIGPGSQATNRFVGCRFSPDGARLLTLSFGGALQVWNVATGDPITPPFQAAGRLTRLAFSPDGERVLAVSAEPGSPTPPEVRVWQADSGKLLLSRPWPNPVLAAGFEGSGESVLIADPLALRRVGVASGKSETRVDYGPASHVALNQDATLLAVAPTNTNPPSVLVYDAATGQPLTKPLPTTNALSHLSFDPAGRLLIGVSTNGDVQLWKVPDGILISSGHVVEKGTSFEGLISPNGDRVLVSGVSSTWLFAATNLVEPIVRYPVHRVTTEAAFSPDGTRFLLVDGTEFRLFRAADGRPATEPVEVGWYVEDASFDATGVRIATVASQAQALIYDLRDGAAAPEKLSLPAGQRFQMLSEDGAWVTASTSSNTISVRSVDGWQPVGPELAHPGEASTLAIGSPPLRVATLSGPNEDGLELRIWEPATGRLIDQPIRLKFSPQRASFSPIGGHLALADPADSLLVTEVDGRLETWSFETAAGLPFDAQIGGGKVYVLRFSSDGKTLAIGTHGHGAQLWDVVRRQHRCHLPHAGPVMDIDFTPDGSRLVTGSLDGAARIWDLATGEPIGLALPHREMVGGVRFTRAGNHLVVATLDGFVHLWDLSTGCRLFQRKGHNQFILRVRTSPAAGLVGTLDRFGKLLIWDTTVLFPIGGPAEGVPTGGGFVIAPDGGSLLATTVSGELRRHPLPVAPLPAPEWLLQLAHALAGNPSTGSIDLLLRLRDQAQQPPREDDFYETWRHWFFANRATRPPSPWTATTRKH
ncbi:MAG: protein kinase [Verrucomicrobiales bacterium]|nr:protein kinase [Verrucomicrobiales bacterium]